VDSNDRLYVADADNHRVQIFDVSNVAAITYLGTVGVTGVSGSDNDHFKSPQGVAVDLPQNRLYVADGYNQRVQVFNYTTWAYQQTLGGFSYVSDVAVDATGNLYVAEPWTQPSDVQQFDSNLNYLRSYGTSGVPYLTDDVHYHQPGGVAVATDGSLYIGEARGRRLIKLSAAGTPLWSKGEPGIWGGDNDHFTYVEDVDVDTNGRVYAADPSNHRIQVFSPGGAYITTLGGSQGTGDYEFNRPWGVALGPDNKVYVADTDNHRVQVYDSTRVYLATIGETGVPGSDNAHFDSPRDVDVDSLGNIYVPDLNNHRVQVFDSSRSYVRTIGESGVAGDDFDHLNSPTDVTVDAAGRIYVADRWGGRVQVFDSDGAYLTTLGGAGGNRTGDLRDAAGLAVDAAGNLYIAERENHRIQKFAPGVPGWVQVNINGFGDCSNRISALAPYGGQLYAGTYNFGGNGAQLWRAADGLNWTPVVTNGFGITRNVGVDHLAEFNGQLYVGTWGDTVNGGEVWRSPNGLSWTRVVSQGFGDPTNGEVVHLAVFSETLYAGTWSYTSTHGAEIWRSSTGNAGDWTQVVANGLGDAANQAVRAMQVFDGHLYVGSYNWANQSNGGEIWRTDDGLTWTRVVAGGFGDASNYKVSALAVFDGYLYAAVGNWDSDGGLSTGGKVYRCSQASGCDAAGDWQQVVGDGFGNPQDNHSISSLLVHDNRLYAVAYNYQTGMEVWRTENGTDWEQVGFAGFGDSHNHGLYSDGSMTAFNNRLFIGTTNWANGGEVWKKTVTADFTANPTCGPPPLQVAFSNTSAGDYTTSLWDFGDGATSTETSPTHTYDLGVYDVILTVSDGMDTSTFTRTSYIQAVYRVHLPVVLRDYDPLLYDNFDDPAYDGSWNPGLWSFSGETFFHAEQRNGAIKFSNVTPSTVGGATLVTQQPVERTLEQLGLFEARLKMSSDRSGDGLGIALMIWQDSLADHPWISECSMSGSSSNSQAAVSCNVRAKVGGSWLYEYYTPQVSVDYDTWHTARIQADAGTATLQFYLDDVLLGSHIPSDAGALKVTNRLSPRIEVWNGTANASATRYVDDVRITPAQP